MAPASDMVLVPREFLEFVKNAPVGSGVCVCGDSMESHGSGMDSGHLPVDQWFHSLSGWLEEIEKPADAYDQAVKTAP